MRYGKAALKSARDRYDGEAEAKAALALGEVYRHGLDQDTAISWYAQSRHLALLAGNVDCFLWAVIGLSDSRFLLGEDEVAGEILHRINKFVETHPHPLETLHIRLSILAIACRKGYDIAEEGTNLVHEYNVLGIHWPKDYLDSLKANIYNQPKRF